MSTPTLSAANPSVGSMAELDGEVPSHARRRHRRRRDARKRRTGSERSRSPLARQPSPTHHGTSNTVQEVPEEVHATPPGPSDVIVLDLDLREATPPPALEPLGPMVDASPPGQRQRRVRTPSPVLEDLQPLTPPSPMLLEEDRARTPPAPPLRGLARLLLRGKKQPPRSRRGLHSFLPGSL